MQNQSLNYKEANQGVFSLYIRNTYSAKIPSNIKIHCNINNNPAAMYLLKTHCKLV